MSEKTKPCPYVVTNGTTSHCPLAETEVKALVERAEKAEQEALKYKAASVVADMAVKSADAARLRGEREALILALDEAETIANVTKMLIENKDYETALDEVAKINAEKLVADYTQTAPSPPETHWKPEDGWKAGEALARGGEGGRREMRGGGDRGNVLELYPQAICARFPVVQPTVMPTRFIVKLFPGAPRFASGNSASQAWRRAYEKILAERRAALTPEPDARQEEGETPA